MGAALSGGAPGLSLARADDWQVTRSPFDPHLIAQLKAQLHAHPDDSGALHRLVSLYKGYRSLDQLAGETVATADKTGAAADFLLAGHVARERGQLDAAGQLYRQAGEHHAEPATVALLLADLALRRPASSDGGPDVNQAQAQLQVALSTLGPGDPRRRIALRKSVDLALASGDMDRAQEVTEELLRGQKGTKGKEAAGLRRDLADALQRHDRPQQALAQWRVLEQDTDLSVGERAEAALHVGEMQEATKDDSGAIATYHKGLSLLPRTHPQRRDFYEHLIAAHRHRDDLASLAAAWEAEWPVAGRGFTEWELLGRLYDERGDTDKASAAYRAALGRSPHSIDVRRRLIAVLERGGATEDVIREYERLSADAPGEARYYLELGERQERAGQRQKALGTLARAAARFAGGADALALHAALSDLYQRWGELDLALKEAELLVRIDPKDEGHIINLGEIYWARGKKDKADEAWRRLLLTNPDRALGQARLADIYAEHNLMGQAIELYQKALKAEPQNLPLKRGLATALERMNRQRDALPLWEQIYFAASQPTLSSDRQSEGPNESAAPGKVPGKVIDKKLLPLLRPLQLEARQHLAALVAKDTRLHIVFHGWQQRFSNHLERLRRKEPGEPAAELLPLGLLTAEACLRLSQVGEAEAVLRSLADALPQTAQTAQTGTTDGDPRASRNKGEVLLALVPVYRQEHKLAEAIAALKQAVLLLPDQKRELYAQLAELSMQSYHDDEAVGFAEKAALDAQGELRLAELLERKDDVPRAMAAYRRAIERDDRLFRAHLELARLHLRGGQLAEAAALYREVARRAPQEEMVLQAGQKAIDLHEYLGTLGDLVRDLSPLSYAYPPKPVYRKLLLLLYERHAAPLLEAARAGDETARAELLHLGHSGLKPLTEALVDGDSVEQKAAIALLGELGNQAAAPALLHLAEGAAVSTGSAAAGSAAAGSSAPAGRAAARSSSVASPVASSVAPRVDIDLRVDALLAAARLADPHGAAALLRLSQASEKQLRVGALYGLINLQRDGRPPGKGEAAALERALSDPTSEGKALGCLGLGRLAAVGAGREAALLPRLRAQMTPIIEHASPRGPQRGEAGDPLAAAACAHALGQARETASVPLLIEALKEGNDELQQQAAWALGELGASGDRQAVVPLWRAVFFKAEPVRQAAAAALVVLGSGRVATTGTAGAAPADRPSASASAQAQAPAPAPAQGLPWPERGVDGLDVRRLLSALSTTQAPTPAELLATWARGSESEALLPILEEALAAHRDLALRTLRDLSPPRGARPDTAEVPLPLLTGLLPGLRRLALHPPADAPPSAAADPAVRGAALALLGRLPGEEPTHILEQAALSDPDPELRQQAVMLLAHGDSPGTDKLGDDRRSPFIPADAGLKGPPALRAIDERRSAALRAIVSLLGSPDRRLRLSAMGAAAALPDPNLLPAEALARAQRDPDGYVREAAGRLKGRR